MEYQGGTRTIDPPLPGPSRDSPSPAAQGHADETLPGLPGLIKHGRPRQGWGRPSEGLAAPWGPGPHRRGLNLLLSPTRPCCVTLTCHVPVVCLSFSVCMVRLWQFSPATTPHAPPFLWVSCRVMRGLFYACWACVSLRLSPSPSEQGPHLRC